MLLAPIFHEKASFFILKKILLMQIFFGLSWEQFVLRTAASKLTYFSPFGRAC
jgi:hypothetical protein